MPKPQGIDYVAYRPRDIEEMLRHLTPTEEGVWHRLVRVQLLRGGVPDSEELRERLVPGCRDAWASLTVAVDASTPALFTLGSDGVWRSPWACAEGEAARSRVERSKSRATAGAHARWGGRTATADAEEASGRLTIDVERLRYTAAHRVPHASLPDASSMRGACLEDASSMLALCHSEREREREQPASTAPGVACAGAHDADRLELAGAGWLAAMERGEDPPIPSLALLHESCKTALARLQNASGEVAGSHKFAAAVRRRIGSLATTLRELRVVRDDIVRDCILNALRQWPWESFSERLKQLRADATAPGKRSPAGVVVATLGRGARAKRTADTA
jgi:hypothetical protein